MKRLALILGIFTLLLISSSTAQQRWERTYGGTGEDYGYSVQQTSDGGYVIAGQTSSFGAGAWDVWLIKTNASGDTLWTRTYGGTSVDWGSSVQQTSDYGYIIAGMAASFGGVYVYLIKTNASGDTLWTKTYGGTGNNYGNSVRQTSDGGYVVAGNTNAFGNGYQVYLVKTNSSGDTLWTRTYGGTGNDWGNSVQQTSDGGYIIAGMTNSFGDSDQVYLIKTNVSGDTLWTRTYGGARNDWGESVQQTSDYGYIIAGLTTSFGDVYGDVYLIKTNVAGDTLWTRAYGGPKSDAGYSVRQTSDGGFTVAGITKSFADTLGGDVYLIKTTASGDTLWTRTYGGTSPDEGESVEQTSDNGFIIAGYTLSFGVIDYDVYLIKTDANGNVGVEESAEVRGKRLEVRLTATPNPFTSFATLPGHEAERFSLYDISGRKVGTYRGDRVGEGLAPGVYFLRSSDSKDKPLRIVKVR